MSETYTWLVTGSNRGIGLEYVTQLSSNPSNIVIAACRDPSSAKALDALKTKAKAPLHIIKLDTSDEAAIKAVAPVVEKIVGDKGLDYLLNNAAITEGDDKAFNFSSSGMIKSLQVNLLGPALLAQSLLPLIERSKRKAILNKTSGLASIGLDFGDKNASYSISKTALNMLTYKQARERPDLIVFVLDPGWVKTDMGGPGAQLEPSEAVRDILAFAQRATKEDSGKFFNRLGEVVPW
ncbi:hypothetical protein JAAARDRAFT_38592 [Jaapia argillacea MUCL 33604]|uniref:NAD(P)-binding protein n=1 Tax=Jaapia argillacea MUCL 33604 TaxID=933084 RepID=A0A067PI38_9AGAM|nr:hypothetical protein JAAARDRAFT_38592 [Jaapia argillacea MUCL 33604]